jgi:hypothetical protein
LQGAKEKDRHCKGQKKKTDIARAKRKRQTLQVPNEKDRHCKGQKKKTDIARAKRNRQTLQGPKEKDRHCKGQKKKTDTARAKRKSTKRTTMADKILHRDIQIYEHEPNTILG